MKILGSDIKFLSSNFNTKGFSDIPQEKCQALSMMRSPRSHAELFSCMGQFAFIASHIPFSSKISAPLRNLMVSEKFYWDKNCHLAFETLKLATRMNIKNFVVRPNLPIFVFTDASKFAPGVSVVICQIWDKHLHIVACQSRIFRQEDRVKSAVECIALKFLLTSFS